MLFLPAFAHSIHDSVKGLDPAYLKEKIEARAWEAARELATPADYHPVNNPEVPVSLTCIWNEAYMAYVFGGLANGKSLNDLLMVDHRDDREEILRPYYNEASEAYHNRSSGPWNGWGQNKLEKDWETISSALSSYNAQGSEE